MLNIGRIFRKFAANFLLLVLAAARYERSARQASWYKHCAADLAFEDAWEMFFAPHL
jgi:hypothetical protein